MDLHVVTNVWPTSCRERYMVCNITVKLTMHSDTSRKYLRGEDHKQVDFFAHFQTAVHSGFINDTEIRFIDNTDPFDPTRREDFWVDTLKTRYPQGLNNSDPLLFLQFY